MTNLDEMIATGVGGDVERVHVMWLDADVADVTVDLSPWGGTARVLVDVPGIYGNNRCQLYSVGEALYKTKLATHWFYLFISDLCCTYRSHDHLQSDAKLSHGHRRGVGECLIEAWQLFAYRAEFCDSVFHISDYTFVMGRHAFLNINQA